MAKALTRKQLLAGFGGKRRQSLAKHGKRLHTPADDKRKKAVAKSTRKSVKRKSPAKSTSNVSSVLTGILGLGAGAAAVQYAPQIARVVGEVSSTVKAAVAAVKNFIDPQEAQAMEAVLPSTAVYDKDFAKLASIFSDTEAAVRLENQMIVYDDMGYPIN